MTGRRSPIAKYHRVEVALAGRIRSGFYGDGALPAERALAEEFDVARVTIRHALQRLDEQGLVARSERRGTTALHGSSAVRRPRLLREHVDQFLDRGRKDQRKVLRLGRVAASVPVATALALQPGEPVLRVVRVRSRLGIALTYTESYVRIDLAHALDRATLTKQALIQALEDAGVKIGSAEQSVRAERCPQDVASALGLMEHEPMLRLKRTVFDQQGKPVQLLLGWYRAEVFEVQMKMSRADDLTRVWIGQRDAEPG